MIRNLLMVIVLAATVMACNNTQKNNAGNESGENDTLLTPIKITVADYLEKPSELAGKEVIIKGTVSHTCKHGGKRMFIYGDNPEESVEIKAGENIAAFNAELEGSEVMVTGMFTELVVDEAYLNDWEAEVNLESGEEHQIHDGNHTTENPDSVKIQNLEKINNYRIQIAESGKDHLSFYSIECNSFEIVPAPSDK